MTCRSSTCQGVQIYYIASRGLVDVQREKAATIDDFTHAGASDDHSLLAAPLVMWYYAASPVVSATAQAPKRPLEYPLDRPLRE